MDKNDFMIMNCLNNVIPDASPEGTSVCYITQLVDDVFGIMLNQRIMKKLK